MFIESLSSYFDKECKIVACCLTRSGICPVISKLAGTETVDTEARDALGMELHTGDT